MLPLFIYDRKGKRKISMWTAILVSTFRLQCSAACTGTWHRQMAPAIRSLQSAVKMCLMLRKRRSLNTSPGHSSRASCACPVLLTAGIKDNIKTWRVRDVLLTQAA